MDRRRVLWLALPLLLASECGPTPQEAGTAALLAILPVLLVEALGLVGLTVLWRRLRPDLCLEVPWRAWALVLGGHALAFLFTLPAGALEGAWTWSGFALYVVGSAHAAVLLVTWRVLLHLRPAGAAVAGPVVASVLVLGPALLMVSGGLGKAASDRVIDAWFWVGTQGWTPAILVVLLLVEAWIRGVIRRRAAPGPTGSDGPRT